MKAPLTALVVLAASIATFGCSGSGDAEGDTEVELLTFWSQKSELDAINAVIEVNHQKHPNVNVRVLKSKSVDALGSDVRNRLAEGTPPTAFQANLGGNAQQWADSAQPLNTRAKAWSDGFLDSILELLTADSQLIGVPLALTRQNNAYYNVKLLDDLGLDIPVGRDGLDAWLAALAAKGYTHPLCIGDEYNWVSSHALFEDIVPSYMGAEHDQQFWSGKLSADDPMFSEALDYAASLTGYWNTDFDKLDWDAGLARVMETRDDPAEQCLMTPMGDWGGAILSGSFTVDEDFSQRSWPGAEELFVLDGDAFVTPLRVENADAALDLFDTLASEEGQIAFNAIKGSVPARSLAKDKRRQFSPLTQANMADLSKGAVLPAFKVIGSPNFPWGDLATRTHDFILTSDKQPIIDFIARNYDKLGG